MNSVNLDRLRDFLIKANMPHATGTADIKKEGDGSRTISFSDGDYRMDDNFFGGEPYGGRLVIFHKEKPIFIEVYYGWVHNTERPVDEVYDFLREALQYPDESMPYRGPAEYTKGSLTYRCSVNGDMANHYLEESIFEGDTKIYSGIVIGGLVDQNARDAM
ncbi:hypothetical protein KDA23_03470 [Candidatus Saccharibacteria bacterium]|nr:hypothetical protein [Candidatus Saccharibacteria bacterium]